MGTTKESEMQEQGKVTGTFAQEQPQPGRTWHVITKGHETACGHILAAGRFEVWTTSTMPEWKVCADCLSR